MQKKWIFLIVLTALVCAGVKGQDLAMGPRYVDTWEEVTYVADYYIDGTYLWYVYGVDGAEWETTYLSCSRDGGMMIRLRFLSPMAKFKVSYVIRDNMTGADSRKSPVLDVYSVMRLKIKQKKYPFM